MSTLKNPRYLKTNTGPYMSPKQKVLPSGLDLNAVGARHLGDHATNIQIIISPTTPLSSLFQNQKGTIMKDINFTMEGGSFKIVNGAG